MSFYDMGLKWVLQTMLQLIALVCCWGAVCLRCSKWMKRSGQCGEKYQSPFSEYIKRGIEADNIQSLYKKVHAAIRADPTAKKTEKEPHKQHKRFNLKKLTYEERKAKLRLHTLNAAAGADSEEED
ncbi:hypothetical protein J1N35_024916 [Gossypium stocksii]|uniref:Large ribosomal subunit protein uL18 C-terminal eukaryotes domain-containing protein n=1 Tax=Gossypium stocksii TaxID=47602 RepID=A0A9D3ZXT6_9ROSI|nr:hypothetical protein J1N35_024916 [Gossypium stocksii]